MEEYDIVAIGGGPAGLTVGLYGGRYGLKTLIIEKQIIGGAMAILSSMRYANTRGSIMISSYVFGCPKIAPWSIPDGFQGIWALTNQDSQTC